MVHSLRTSKNNYLGKSFEWNVSSSCGTVVVEVNKKRWSHFRGNHEELKHGIYIALNLNKNKGLVILGEHSHKYITQITR